MKQSRYNIIVFEILGIIAFAAALIFFDRTLTNNDLSVVLLMAGLGAFVLAGFSYDYDRPAVADVIPFVMGILGFLAAAIGIGAAHFNMDWAMVVSLVGIFAVFSDLCFTRIANR